jgi:hypothetical protein
MGGAREIVFDMALRFWCQNGVGRVYNITGFAFGKENVPLCDDESCDREL